MKKILVIDDDKTTVKLLESRLKDKGFEVSSAYDGDEGLEKAQQVKPDMIILDVEMPRMNGYTFMMEKAKKGEPLKSVPVVVLTSHDDKQPIFQLRGVKDYLLKPVDFNILFSKIDDYVVNKRSDITGLVFVIEENETQIKLMKHFLEKGFIPNLEFCSDFETAINEIKSKSPSIIVLNFQICSPEEDGYSLSKKIKDSGTSAKLILLCPEDMEIDNDKTIASGADKTAVKSPNYSNLIDVVHEISAG